MTDLGSSHTAADGALALEPARVALGRGAWRRVGRALGLLVLWGFVLGNAGAIVWLWVDGGNVHVSGEGEIYNSVGRITGLLGAYLALVQIALLARLQWLERLVGFDRLTVWHRWNGFAVLWLVVAHTVFQVWGYAKLDFPPVSFAREFWAMLSNGIYPGMITATVGTFLVIVVALSSLALLRRRLPYELWYAVHFAAYAGIALAWFHQVPTGNDLILKPGPTAYWKSLYVATLALIAWRVLVPLATGLRYRLRVAEVVPEAPGIVSLRITGSNVDRLRVRPGQFFLWRFLTRGFWWTSLPFSLSAAPDGRSLRITVKDLGNHSGRVGRIRPGTRVAVEGPFGVFTDARRTREKVLLVAGGIGITPVRALLEELEGDVVVLYRVLREQDLVFSEEIDRLARERGFEVHHVVGDHTTPEGRELLSPEHLRRLVPDVGEREVYLCGPPAMTAVIQSELRRSGVPRRHLHVERFAL